MTVKQLEHRAEKYVGLSTDTKPAAATYNTHPLATFYEYDTDQLFITYDGTNWVRKDQIVKGILKRVSVTKALAAASGYTANDVLCENATTGVPWTFSAIARANGASGYIVGAIAQSESENVTPRLTLYLYKATPTGELRDNAANTNPDMADLANFVGKIDFPALESVGTTDSVAIATVSTYGNLPIPFVCASDADDLIGILVTRDDFTQTAGDDMTITIIVEQY